MTSIPSKSVTLVLTLMILSVYILQQNSDILDKMLVNRIGEMDNYASVRPSLNKGMSRQLFMKRTKELRHKIDNIAAQQGGEVRKQFSKTVDKIIQSRTIVYNRIDKAGSTTLISKINLIIPDIITNTVIRNSGQDGLQKLFPSDRPRNTQCEIFVP